MTAPAQPSTPRRGARRLEMGEGGQAFAEFALTFPWVILACLSVMQLALMYATQNMVDYAAFCAARSAAVYVPRHNPLGISGEGESEPNLVDDFKKYGKIHLAAAIPLSIMSPSAVDIGSNFPGLGGAFGSIGDVFANLPGDVQDVIKYVDRLAYAYAATSILGGEISVTSDPSDIQTGSGYYLPYDFQDRNRGDLFVRVTYVKYLEIPFINAAMARVWPLLSNRPLNQATASFGSPDMNFWNISGFCKIPAEGTSLNPEDEPMLQIDPWQIGI